MARSALCQRAYKTNSELLAFSSPGWVALRADNFPKNLPVLQDHQKKPFCPAAAIQNSVKLNCRVGGPSLWKCLLCVEHPPKE